MSTVGRSIRIHKCRICNETVKYMNRHLRLNHPGVTAEQYYLTYLNTSSNPGHCLYCNKPTHFVNIFVGYNRYCNAACQMHDPEMRDRTFNAQIEKFGGIGFASKELKEKSFKKQIERYGGIGFASKELNEKTLQSCNEKYNTNYETINDIIHTVPEIANKIIETRRKKNGGECMSPEHKQKFIAAGCTEEAISKRLNTRYMNNNGKYVNESSLKAYERKLKKTYSYANFVRLADPTNRALFICHCDKCNNDYEIIKNSLRSRHIAGQEPCTVCSPLYSIAYNTSKYEKEIIEYISEFINGAKIEQSNRSILNGKELDIYMPEKKLAIEFDGLWWHSELYKDETVHLWKTTECEKQGIQLIHIFEDEWKSKNEIVKSRLKGLLGRNERIYARKTICKEISYAESKDFLEKNHIQGNCNSKYRYGLYYNDELVAVMTFGESRFKKGEFELLRFANKLYTNVVGGAGKLFKHFLSDHPEINEIVSYADRRWSKGNLYETLGFTKKCITEPNYYYIINDHCESRFKFQKHKLVEEGYDPNKTEHEIMLERKIYRIYDCGNLKYTYEALNS